MTRLKVFVLTLCLVQLGTTSGQDFGGSGGQVVGAIGNVIKSLMSNTSSLNTVVDMVKDPGAFLAKGGNSNETLGLLKNVMSTTSQVRADCLLHMGMFVEALTQRQEWALRMVDAIGKPPSGVLNFKLMWMGDWDECTTAEATVYENFTLKSNPSNPFTGKYCPVKFPVPVPGAFGQKASLTIGTCFPDSCSGADLTALMKLILSFQPTGISIPEPEITCQEKTIDLDSRAIIVIVVCVVFATAMTIATIYDVVYVNWLAKNSAASPKTYQNGINLEGGIKATDVFVVENGSLKDTPGEKSENGVIQTKPEEVEKKEAQSQNDNKYKPSVLEGILLSFSVFTNGTKILNTNQPKGALTAVNGIRFISMTWVIVGHGFAWLSGPEADNAAQYYPSLAKRREFTAIVNGTFSVDTFFVLSGLLVSYLSLKELKKVNGAKGFNWGMYYFHRIWRLTPPYMLLMLLYVSLDKYIANGPIWPQGGFERETCAKSWWTNVLYINNLVKVDDKMLSCFGWTWYLANDMQFYIISPLVLIPLYYFPILGSLKCLALVLTSAISAGLVSNYYELPSSNIFEPDKQYAYMWYYYVKPWCRVGPYAVGLFTGYMLYRSQLKMKINRMVNVFLWLVAIALGFLIIYCLFSADFQDPLTRNQAALYNATARIAWGACVAWVIYACANGYGGPINHLLSWSGFVPLGRLTYFAYLVHPMLMFIEKDSRFSTVTLYDYGVVYVIIGHLCMSYAMAFVLSLAFEAPMMGLEKVLLGRGKRN